MNIGEQIITQLLEQSTPIVALYPGKFKPPHAGHFDVVTQASKIADKVIVVMSQGSKEEFTPEKSMEVWNLYKDLLPSNVEIIISQRPSPLNDVFDMVKDKTQDYIVLYGKGERSRYAAVERDREKYSNVDIVDAGTFEGLHATDLRNAINNKNLEDIQKHLPKGIDAQKVLNIYSKDEFKPGPMLHELFEKDLPNIEKISPTEYLVDNGDDIEAKYYFRLVVPEDKAWSVSWGFTPNNKNKSPEAWKQVTSTSYKIIPDFLEKFKPTSLHISGNSDSKTNVYKRYADKLQIILNNKYRIDNNNESEVVLRSIEESAKFNIKKRMETMNESYSQALNYFKNGDIFAQSKSERNSTLKKYNSRKQLSETYNIPFKNNLLLEAFTKDKAPLIKKLVDFACEQLEIDQPHISLITSPTYTQEHSSFGGYMPSDEKIMVVVHNRNMADILRTLAHELVHHMQNRRGELDQDSGEDGSPIENEANATAGIIMRKFGRENPQIFEGKVYEQDCWDGYKQGDPKTKISSKTGERVNNCVPVNEEEDQTITCENCGWDWKLSEGGNDPYICHKCGHDNDSSNGLNEIGEANLEPYKWKVDDIAGRYTYTSFTTPTETKYEVDLTSTEVPDFEDKNEYVKAIDIEFSAKPKDAEGSSSKIVVNKGELYRVMSTIVDIIKYYLRQSNGDIKAILYSPSKKSNELDFGSQRDNLYKAFITKAIPGAKIEQQGEYVITYILDDIDEYDVENEQDLKEFTLFLKEYTQQLSESEINEAEYQGRTVPLGKPMQGDSKKFKVYVKNSKGKVVKVNFGAKGMNIKKNNPVRRKAFRARHNCDNPGPRDKARYWSCRKW